jgi:signal transduction histidine kinase
MINATLNEIIDEKLKEFLTVALKSASLLDYLIKDILDFSQISYKKLRLNLEDFDIKAIIHEVFSLMRFQAQARSFTLELETFLPEGLSCKSDPNRIKQILINLLGFII